MKTLAIICKGEITCATLTDQLHSLLGNHVHIKSYYLDNYLPPWIEADLIVASSPPIQEKILPRLTSATPIIIARRSPNYHEIEKVLAIPVGTEVLLVNDTPATTQETISHLQALGIDHITYFPFSPQTQDYPPLPIAVTPGEVRLVPDCVKTVIDIKTRVIDFTTIVEILNQLSLGDKMAHLLSATFVKDMVQAIRKNRHMADMNIQIKNRLQTVVNRVNDGIIAIDGENNISVCNPIAGDLLGLACEEVIGHNLSDNELPKAISLLCQEDPSESERFIRLNGRHLLVTAASLSPSENSSERVYVVKDVTEIQRVEEELRRKIISERNVAIYSFDQIHGYSTSIKSAKTLAKKIAASDSPVLIQGESGTGKELFAQGLHNASIRKNGPFIAVNFAALSESLLESELFGYTEGSFTGAKKGGSAGLFEQAHKGTLFLDEIGDAPLSFQIKLLRVLQEKQVRRIGGSRIIPIDVRIIAATNKNLKDLILKNEFRQDLYYRLNVLSLKLPPLRERRADVTPLIHDFYLKYFTQNPAISPDEYFQHIKAFLETYNWPGNIRELHNVVEYLVNVCPDFPPTLRHLPEDLAAPSGSKGIVCRQGAAITPDTVLAEIHKANMTGTPIGRRSLAQRLQASENVIRQFITHLEAEGRIRVHRGVRGLEITQ